MSECIGGILLTLVAYSCYIMEEKLNNISGFSCFKIMTILMLENIRNTFIKFMKKEVFFVAKAFNGGRILFFVLEFHALFLNETAGCGIIQFSYYPSIITFS